MNYIIFAIIMGAIITLIIVLSSISTNKKFAASIANSFGKRRKDADDNFDSISSYYCQRLDSQPDLVRIDDITWNDLDMDSIFQRINVCSTSIGEEYLYNVLHEPMFEDRDLIKREKLIRYLENKPDIRLQLQVILSKMGKLNFNGLSDFIFDIESKSLKHPLVYKIFAVIPLLCVAFLIVNFNVALCALLLSFVANVVVYYVSKKDVESELGAINYFASTLWCCGKISKIDDSQFKGFVMPLIENFAVFKSLAGKVSGMMKKGFSEVDFLAEYIKIIFLTDLRNYNRAIAVIAKNSENFHTLYRELGEIDLAICILSFRRSLDYYTIPQFHSADTVDFTELYHPLLSHPVENSGSISNNCIITGSNASGKSTFVKAIAINCVLAQTIYTATAREFSVRFSLVMTSMAVRDNISQGDSYFIAEIKSLKRILEKIKTVYCTCFIDEILKGTNTIERIAASAAVLKFIDNANCLCMVASHDIELTEMLGNLYDNYHFCEQIEDNAITFDYKLKSGASKTRNAIKLLHYMEFDNQVVEDSENLIEGFMTTKKWEVF